MTRLRLPALALLAAISGSAGAQGPSSIEARRMAYPGGHPQFENWKSYPVRTFQQLGLPASDEEDKNEDIYGGKSAVAAPATGYFYTRKIDGRWWIIDPLGHLYLHNAIVDLHPGPSARNQKALQATFGDQATWMQKTHEMLLENGIHGAGAWSSTVLIKKSPLQATHPLAYTINLDIMAAYGRVHGGTHPVPGHQGYPQDTIFVFDPAFPAFADKYLSRIDGLSTDPALLGYFSDNEIPLYRSNLEGFLRLPASDPGHIAAQAWMQERHASVITDELRSAFLEYEADRYFSIVVGAIRKHDPNHMYLGCRYTSQQLVEPVLFRAAGKYSGAVSINYYSGWHPDAESMTMWEREAQKPFMITEFYVKGDDSGLSNITGAGWLVHTQADRGVFYQSFVLTLLQSGKCVGWHWFKYQDNDPQDSAAELSNLDSNKGIVDADYKPYVPLLTAMRELNLHLYQVVDLFYRQAKPSADPSPRPDQKH